MTRTRPPLVAVALDAADPDLLLEWAAEGYLPTLRSVLEAGWWGRTGGAELESEHGVWVTLLSGRSRAEHGYHYFRQLRPGSYDLELVSGHEVGAPPFWADLGEDRRVAIIDIPDAPLVPGLQGIQLADWAVHNPERSPSAHPETVLEEARRVFGPPDPIEEHLRSTEADDRRLFARLLGRVARKGRMCRHLAGGEAYDLIAVGFGEGHTGGHQFWKYRPGGAGEVPGGPLTNAIRDLYAAIDREVGHLLDAVGNANVVVLSSVGIRDQYPMTGISETLLRALGYQAAPPATAGWPRPIDLIRRWLPEPVRIALSRRLSREQRERLLADQFRTATDWSRTTAFTIPSAYATFVRVNLRGREPQGIVEPSDYDLVLDRVEADVRQLTDPETGEHIAERFERTRRVFGPQASASLPDLIVHWRPSRRFLRRVAHPRATLVQDEPEFFRDSDHSAYGFIAAAGPAFGERGDVGDVDALAVAPLLRRALGLGGPTTPTTGPLPLTAHD